MQHSIRQSSNIVAAVALAAGVVCLAGSLVVAVRIANSGEDRAAIAYATAVSNQVRATIAAHTGTIAKLAEQPRVVAAFSNPDPLFRTELEAELKTYFADAWNLRLIQGSVQDVDASAEPDIGYADLAMIRESEQGEKPPPASAHALGTDQAHISIIQRTMSTDGKTVLGHLMVFFRMALAERYFTDLALATGYAEIRQPTKDAQAQTLATVGLASLKNEAQPMLVPIAGTRWELAYWRDPATKRLPIGKSVLLILLVVVCFALVAVAAIVAGRIAANRVRSDMAAFVTAVRDFAAGNLRESYPVQSSDHVGAMTAMLEELRKARIGSARPKPIAENKPTGGTPDIDL